MKATTLRPLGSLQNFLRIQHGQVQIDEDSKSLATPFDSTSLKGRSELGMVGNSETFYQIVTPATPAPAAPATSITARTQ